MISDRGRSNRSARRSSSFSAAAKWRALKRPVFGSTRASSCSCGTESERWISRSGATANGISHGFVAQKAAIATPSIASTRSVERLGNENSPDSRSEWPRARWSIGAISRWFTATIAAAADRPASAYSTSDAGASRRTPWKAAYAASIDSVQLQMLKIWMYQALRFFSHSGMCWTTPISTISSGGSSITAGIRKTIVVW
jgi:hypothetical protein